MKPRGYTKWITASSKWLNRMCTVIYLIQTNMHYFQRLQQLPYKSASITVPPALFVLSDEKIFSSPISTSLELIWIISIWMCILQRHSCCCCELMQSSIEITWIASRALKSYAKILASLHHTRKVLPYNKITMEHNCSLLLEYTRVK